MPSFTSNFDSLRDTPVWKRWAAGVLLLLVVFLGDRGIGYGLHRLLLSSELRYSQMYAGGLEMDGLILGSSRGVNGFYAPGLSARLGTEWLNLSHNGVSTRLLEALLRDYLELNAKPEIVIVEVTSVQSDLSAIMNLKMYWGQSEHLGALAREYSKKDYYGAEVSWLYAHNSEMFLRAMHYLDRTDQDWINRYSITTALLEQTRELPPQQYEAPKPENVAALRRILELCQQQDIEVRLVFTPLLPAYVGKLENLDAWIASLQAEIGGGQRIYNYAAALDDPNDFADRVHLNVHGVETLMEQMIADGVFGDAEGLARP